MSISGNDATHRTGPVDARNVRSVGGFRLGRPRAAEAIGAFDNVSVVVRHTLVQVLTPDAMRGRVSAVNNIFIGASNEIGGLESGLTAAWLGPVKSVVLGGVGTVLTVVMTALLAPQLRRYGPLQSHADEEPAPAPATPAPATQ